MSDLQRNFCQVSLVHWQATHNDGMLVAYGQSLGLSTHATEQWFDALTEFFKHEGMSLHTDDGTTWLLDIQDAPVPKAPPVHDLLNQSMMPSIKTLDNTLFWQRVLTEAQMFCSGHVLNTQNPEAYSVNGIWVWDVRANQVYRTKFWSWFWRVWGRKK